MSTQYLERQHFVEMFSFALESSSRNLIGVTEATEVGTKSEYILGRFFLQSEA